MVAIGAGTLALPRLARHRGTDMLLSDLGLDVEHKRALMERAREGAAPPVRADQALERQPATKFRQERPRVHGLLDPAQDEASALWPGLAVLRHRSDQLVPLVAELKVLEAAGRLSVPLAGLAPSYVHMFINRLLRSAQNAQEWVLYDFLGRLYESQAARARRQNRNSPWLRSGETLVRPWHHPLRLTVLELVSSVSARPWGCTTTPFTQALEHPSECLSTDVDRNLTSEDVLDRLRMPRTSGRSRGSWESAHTEREYPQTARRAWNRPSRPVARTVVVRALYVAMHNQLGASLRRTYRLPMKGRRVCA